MKHCKGCGSPVRSGTPNCRLCGGEVFEDEGVPVSVAAKPAAPGGTEQARMNHQTDRTGSTTPGAGGAGSPRSSAGPVSLDSLLAQTGAARPVGLDTLLAQMDSEPDSESARALHFAPSHSLNGGMRVIGASALLPRMLEIPSRYRGEPVTEIAFQAFCHTNIVSVRIPETVRYIGDRAFEDCRALTCVKGCEGLSMIGRRAFAGCLHLIQFDLPEQKPNACADSFAGCFDSGMAFESRVSLDEGD